MKYRIKGESGWRNFEDSDCYNPNDCNLDCDFDLVAILEEMAEDIYCQEYVDPDSFSLVFELDDGREYTVTAEAQVTFMARPVIKG